MDILATVGAAVSIVTLIALVGGGFYWWGRLYSRVDALAEDVKTLRDDVQSVRGEVQSVRSELLTEIQSVRGEVQSVRSELLTEMRRSEDRILTALTRHSHVSPEAGPPVFWQPIGVADPASPPSQEAPTTARDPGVASPPA
jgi:hypothetical protein